MVEVTREDIADQAAAWVARMDVGEWSDSQEAELERWLSQDKRCSGALLQAQALWLSIDPQVNAVALAGEPALIKRRAFVLGGTGLVAASLAGLLFWNRSSTVFRTDLGEIRQVPLADGSSTAINTASEIEITLSKGRRDVRLAKGEAWFKVAKDPARPFVVEAGGVWVRAIGTAFSVRRREEGVDVLVTEGVVEAWAGENRRPLLRLTAGQRAYIGEDAEVRLEAETPSVVDRTLAWRQGSIDLDGDTLAGAVNEFNRYNRRKIVLIDTRLASRQFDGTFRTDEPEAFAQAVGTIFNVPIDLTDERDIRIGRPQ
ncbi:transmembrane sensor [Sphingomonas insulae]|uniref:FecR domain-containing protein n=1 Tax=Sphingomonas insulae TaxID=424800 RepID=A0ABP3T2H4_9SPHN|nr:FecR domain-containing protein [Sphingomonas insulae]NIJ30727.1 transmembrane sensor [Sphingomonas insulae]